MLLKAAEMHGLRILNPRKKQTPKPKGNPMIDQKNAPENLTDSELDEVTGGLNDHKQDKTTGKYYKWTQGDDHLNEMYLCPNCKRPVHRGFFDLFYCDPCDASWGCGYRLIPNVGAGFWAEISQEEYDRYVTYGK